MSFTNSLTLGFCVSHLDPSPSTCAECLRVLAFSVEKELDIQIAAEKASRSRDVVDLTQDTEDTEDEQDQEKEKEVSVNMDCIDPRILSHEAGLMSAGRLPFLIPTIMVSELAVEEKMTIQRILLNPSPSYVAPIAPIFESTKRRDPISHTVILPASVGYFEPSFYSADPTFYPESLALSPEEREPFASLYTAPLITGWSGNSDPEDLALSNEERTDSGLKRGRRPKAMGKIVKRRKVGPEIKAVVKNRSKLETIIEEVNTPPKSTTVNQLTRPVWGVRATRGPGIPKGPTAPSSRCGNEIPVVILGEEVVVEEELTLSSRLRTLARLEKRQAKIEKEIVAAKAGLRKEVWERKAAEVKTVTPSRKSRSPTSEREEALVSTLTKRQRWSPRLASVKSQQAPTLKRKRKALTLESEEEKEEAFASNRRH